MFALVDCNNFYASCQRVFNPQLIGKPIVVLSNNDGCVIARSNEAKALGIPMGAPAFEYQHLFDQHTVSVFSANFALYGDMSRRVMNMLSTYSPDIEIYSIDEAFLSFKGFDQFDLNTIGLDMQYKVTKGTGIPISVGIAPTKALAKVANKIAKKFPERTKSVYLLDDPQKIQKALQWTAINDVWGIGNKLAAKLLALGVKNALQFTRLDAQWVKQHMSIVGLRLQRELQGKPTLALEQPQDKQSIATTRSFDKPITAFELAAERVATYTAVCAEKLRKQYSHCNIVTVFIHTNNFRADQPQYSQSFVMQTGFPTNSTIELCKLTRRCLELIWKDGYAYKKAGVILSGIEDASVVQSQLFGGTDPKHAAVMQMMDKINSKIGKNIMQLASQSPGRRWKMKQEKLSPHYTTRLEDIITVH